MSERSGSVITPVAVAFLKRPRGNSPRRAPVGQTFLVGRAVASQPNYAQRAGKNPDNSHI